MTTIDNIYKIHGASVKILERTGVVFHHNQALEACRKYGLKVDGEKVFFSEKQVMELLSMAPKSFRVTPYNENRAVAAGVGQTSWATGGGASNVLEPDSSHRSATFRDFVDFLKIAHSSPVLTSLSTLVVQAADLPLEHSPALKFFYASQLSDKVLVGLSGNRKNNRAVLDTAAALYGGAEEMAKKPRFFGIVSTLSPLRLDGNAIEALIDWAEAGQPSAVTPCTMAGSTGPITLAGSLALSNAETLAGLALAQIVHPGAPVLYGCQSTTADPKTASISIGAPEQATCILYGAALADFYGLPCRGGGLLTDADRVNAQSGYEAMMTGLATRRAGYDLVLHGAGIVCGYAAISFEQFIIDLEIIGMIEKSMAEIEVNDQTLALDIVDALGSGGGYLTHSHTARHCRQNWLPKISYRGHLGGPDNRDYLFQRLEKEKKRCLESYRPPDLSETIIKDMQKALARHGIEGGLLFASKLA